MWLQSPILLLLGTIFVARRTDAHLSRKSSQCAPNEYWCQDRCGSTDYGDTCCTTPDGQHNLCGTGTTCCMYGCCPGDTTCNEVGACIEKIITTNSVGQPTTLTSTVIPAQTTITGTSALTQTGTTTHTGTDTGTATTTASTQIQGGSTIVSTTTDSSGQTVVVFGTDSLTLPSVATSTVLITLGQTFTLTPGTVTSQRTTNVPQTTSLANGVTVISSSDVVVVGTDTIVLPSVSATSELTTDGLTFTLVPTATGTGVGLHGTTTTPSGQTIITISGLLIWSTFTITIPSSLSSATLLATDGQTFTFLPSQTLPASESTTTLPDGQTVTSASGLFIWGGTNTLTIPTGITTPLTLTTDGETFTFEPTGTDTWTPTATTTSTGVLITYTTWPSTASIIPVTTSVDQPKSTDRGGVIPCTAWFFFICISWGTDIIGGWKIPLPPGIYPGPPPGLKWPSGITVTGSLPPWPTITIGNDNIPTYSSEPTSCQTETASICSTTTSFGVSVSNSVTVTTATSTASTCTTIAGCNIENETGTATITGVCSTATVTDVWLSCSATATNSCQTASTSVTSGCGVTATTQSCTVAAATSTSGAVSRRALPECNFGPSTYVVYPIDGTNSAQTGQIYNELLKYASAADIYQSNTQTMGVNFWLLPLTDNQGIEVATQLAGVAASVYTQSSGTYLDPSTAKNWQANAPDDLVFVAQQDNIPLATYASNFYFDDTVNPVNQISVYILDSGAWAGHSEFDLVRNDIQWLLVGQDIDQSTGQMVDPAKDDSQTDPANIIQIGKAHGTAMLSLVTGKTLGVSKGVAPILIRVPRRMINDNFVGGATFEDYIDGLGKLCDHLTTTSTSVTGLLLMSLSFPRAQFLRGGVDESAGFSSRMQALLANLITKGILPLTGTGNTNGDGIDAWPANYASTANGAAAALPELLVVGGVFADSKPTTNDNSQNGGRIYSWDTTKNLPHVYAPAYAVSVAQGNQGLPSIKSSQGTSDGTALTTGLAAYYLRLAQAGVYNFAQTPIGLKNWIISQAWARQPGIPAIWNGAVPDNSACEWNPPAAAKRGLDTIMVRQTGAVSSCGIPASLSSAIAADTISQPGATATTAPTTTTGSTASTLSTVVCNTVTLVPGQCGVPGCAYAIASDLGSEALCSADYCNCGGTVAPLLTSSVSGTWISDCAYTSQPTADSCPSGTGATTTTPPTATAQPTTAAQPTPTAAPLTLGSQQCNNANNFPGHGDIESDFLNEYIGDACAGTALESSIISASNNPMQPFQTETNNVWYFLSITWVDGCVTTVDSQSPWEPIPGNSDVTCSTLFDGDYHDCDNTGVGGSIQVGCLRYLFTPSENGATT